MAKIKVIKKNFSKFLKENLDGALLCSIFLGKDSKQILEDTPDEETMWIDTQFVYAVSGLIKIKETGDTVFQVFLNILDTKNNIVLVKEDCYKEFMKAWSASE